MNTTTSPTSIPTITNTPFHATPTSEWVLVTPNIAVRWMERNHGNRNRRRMHVARLVRDMEGGNYLVTGDTIKFDRDDRLIDGQHRLAAIVETGIPVWMLIVRNLDPKVQTVLDANAKRSASDALGFTGVSEYRTVVAGMAQIALSRASGKMVTALESFKFNGTNAEIIDWFTENPDAEWAASYGVKMSKLIGSTPSVTAYATLLFSRIDPAACSEFFESTSELRTNGTSDPRFTLLRTLERDRKNRGTPNNSTQFSYLVRAWNAWRVDKPLTKLPVENAGKPVVIPEPV